LARCEYHFRSLQNVVQWRKPAVTRLKPNPIFILIPSLHAARMAPKEFSVRLQEGITGGFAPPTPSAIHSITTNVTQPVLNVTSAVRPDGTPQLRDAVPKTLSVSPDSDSNPDVQHTLKLVEELHTILKSIPVEFPPGSQDIYGMDTSIAFQSDDLEWYNGGPSGCGGGTSEVQATDDNKKSFKRAVEIVNELVAKAG